MPYRGRSLHRAGENTWTANDTGGRSILVSYHDPVLTVIRTRKFGHCQLLLGKLVGNAFGELLPDWYVEMVVTQVLSNPARSPQYLARVVPDTDQALAALLREACGSLIDKTELEEA